jgi:hypothetical protein
VSSTCPFSNSKKSHFCLKYFNQPGVCAVSDNYFSSYPVCLISCRCDVRRSQEALRHAKIHRFAIFAKMSKYSSVLLKNCLYKSFFFFRDEHYAFRFQLSVISSELSVINNMCRTQDQSSNVSTHSLFRRTCSSSLEQQRLLRVQHRRTSLV